MQLIQLLIGRSFRSRPLRLLLCIFGITIGVAGILAIGITNQAAMDAIVRLFDESSGRANLMVTAAGSESGISSSLIKTISNLSGIQVTLPIIIEQTALLEQNNVGELELSFFGADSGGLTLYGVDPSLEPLVRDYRITEGNFLSDDINIYDVVLVENYANDEEIKVGKNISIITPNGVEKLRVVGLMAREGPGLTNNGKFGIVPIETAQKMFNRLGEYDQIDLMVTDSSSDQVLESKRLEIQNRIGREYAVTFPASQGQRMTQMLYTYQIGLNFLSAIALFVGAYLIYNAFAMTVVERTREFGMLRTIGMNKAQITLQMVLEAIILGIIGSTFGVFLGIFGARGLTAIMGSLLKTDMNQTMSVPTDTLGLSLLMGIIVTIIGALMPAYQAGQISPIAALRIRGTYREKWLTNNAWKLGSVLIIVATIILIVNPFAYDPQFRAGSATVFFMFAGITLIIPVSTEVWIRFSRPIIQFLFGTSGIVGSRNIQRAKLRTMLTVGALLIGVAMIIVVQSVTAAFTNDVSSWVNSYVGGDFYVYSTTTLNYDLAYQIASIENVKAATPIHYQPVDYQLRDGKYESLTYMAIDPSSYTQVTNFIFSESNTDSQASLEKLTSGEAIFISSVISEKYGLQQGQTMTLRTRSGLKPLLIADVIVDFYNEGLVIVGNWQILRRHFRSNDVSAILVKAEEGANLASVEAQIDSQFGQRNRLKIESNSELRQRIYKLMDQAFSMFDVMAVLAVFIASFGLVNTLTMNVLERIREIGMLRAIGMSRSQVIVMILAEAGLMGIIGGALGLVFGILLSRIFIYAMIAIAGYRLNLVIPLSAVIIGVIISIVVSQFAAIQPARQAANINILEALHYE